MGMTRDAAPLAGGIRAYDDYTDLDAPAAARLVVHGLSLGAQAGSAALADSAKADLVDATL